MELTDLQVSMVLGACPAGSQIVSSEHFRRGYRPAPIRVIARTPYGEARRVVIRLARHGSVEDEARLFGVLAKLGLPVPEVLAGPEIDPELPGCPSIALYSLLPGMDLQELSERSAEDCQTAAKLVVDAATTLAELTSQLRSEPAARFLRAVGLYNELDRIVDGGGAPGCTPRPSSRQWRGFVPSSLGCPKGPCSRGAITSRAIFSRTGVESPAL